MSELAWHSIPKSKDIKALGYDGTNLLAVEFHFGGVYLYEKVPPLVFEALLTAPSVGGAFAKFIRPFPHLYPFTRGKVEKK